MPALQIGGVYDFHRTWDTRRDHIDSYFDSASPFSLFLGKSFNELPHVMNNFVFQGWERFGIVKYVNRNNRPWYTK